MALCIPSHFIAKKEEKKFFDCGEFSFLSVSVGFVLSGRRRTLSEFGLLSMLCRMARLQVQYRQRLLLCAEDDREHSMWQRKKYSLIQTRTPTWFLLVAGRRVNIRRIFWSNVPQIVLRLVFSCILFSWQVPHLCDE